MRLDETLSHIWGMLQRGAADGKHAYHFPVFITHHAGEGFASRTVVLRNCNPRARTLCCYTDVRSDKVAQLRESGSCEWLFYDHRHKEQIRMRAAAHIHHQDELCTQKWRGIPQARQIDYNGSPSPGEPITHPGAFGESETTNGFDHFCIIETVVNDVQWLKLGSERHSSARFQWEGGAWQKRFVAP